MAEKTKSTTESEIRGSVSSLYADILAKRNSERAARQENERLEKEARKAEKEAAKAENGEKKLSKKEQREASFEEWRSVIVGLTGDDLEYSSGKKKKKKYTKWIGEKDGASEMTAKPKKQKKKNYRREFEPELNMLRSIVADQNRFNMDLQKRFQTAAGPATKDAMPLNKTMVELAAAINSGRSNALGYLNAISNVKKTIADLYMKQAKQDHDLGGSGTGATTDPALLGSNIAARMFADNPFLAGAPAGGPNITAPGPDAVAASAGPAFTMPTQMPNIPQDNNGQVVIEGTSIPEFDPASWDGGGLSVTPDIASENIPHVFVLEWNKETDSRRFKAIDPDTGAELPQVPVPTSDPYRLKINETDLTVRGEFDETYKVTIA